MTIVRLWASAGAILGAAMLGCPAARAQTSFALGNTSTNITIGAFQVGISGCTGSQAGAAVSCANWDGTGKPAEVVLSQSRGSLNVEIEGNSGSNFISVASTGTEFYDDLTFSLIVSTTGTPISSFSAALNASDTARPGAISPITASYTSTSTTPRISGSASLASSNETASFTPISALSVSVDLDVDTQMSHAGTVLALDNSTSQYVPEPATDALLLTGFVSLVGLRGRLKLTRARRSPR